MTQRVQDLPGFETILDLSEIPEAEVWTSTDGRLRLTMPPQLYAACRAVLAASSYTQFQAGSRTFLGQHLVAIALDDIENERIPPSPNMALYQEPLQRLRASIRPGKKPLSLDQLGTDLELFLELAMSDYLRAIKQGNANIDLEDEAAYRHALAYFAIKGLVSDIAGWPRKWQKRASQREQAPYPERAANVTVPPIESWLPNEIKPWVVEASGELAERVSGRFKRRPAVDLLSTSLWRGMPQAVMTRLQLAGKPKVEMKTLKNAFLPKSESKARYFTVVHFLLHLPR